MPQKKKKPSPKGKAKRKNLTARKVQATDKIPYVVLDVECKPEEDNDPCDDEGLTIRQRAFVVAITGPAAGNATKAAEMAGYAAENRNSLKSTASRLLTFADVAEAISKAWARKRYSPQWTRDRIMEIASVSMNNFESVNEDGEIVTDFRKAAARGAIGQIREIEETILSDGEDGTPRVIKRKFKLHNPDPAIALLAKMQGLINDAPAERSADIPLEEHPQAGKVAPSSGTAAIDDIKRPIQDGAGG